MCFLIGFWYTIVMLTSIWVCTMCWRAQASQLWRAILPFIHTFAFFFAYIFMHTLNYGIVNLNLTDNIVRQQIRLLSFLSSTGVLSPPVISCGRTNVSFQQTMIGLERSNLHISTITKIQPIPGTDLKIKLICIIILISTTTVFCWRHEKPVNSRVTSVL